MNMSVNLVTGRVFSLDLSLFFASLSKNICPGGSAGKEICLQCGRPGFNPRVGKIPWGRDRLPTPVFLGFPSGSTGRESAGNEEDLG